MLHLCRSRIQEGVGHPHRFESGDKLNYYPKELNRVANGGFLQLKVSWTTEPYKSCSLRKASYILHFTQKRINLLKLLSGICLAIIFQRTSL
jgi:hypothetical protein